jgi:CDP-glycerol glycerophosphotransferase (TagB/SpsB family)
MKNVQILKGFTTIHSVLPKTRVAILDNSTAGIECMMHDVPMITYGYPDYHWVSQDMRSLTQLRGMIETVDNWHDIQLARRFLCYYVFEYLCSDIDTTMNRLKELL